VLAHHTVRCLVDFELALAHFPKNSLRNKQK
jgi:hypothetical protein